ncbi:hypothetical protein EX895_001882 [Sporisorium graminicola]|uniref:Uncharacterized protein n=1 Tax=Sporisorium graminicola TaxID=280036 RepID=A0A4U7KX66_9BASI|nr:hypothetical protein EX895_001882 [Sporisorium graminicola]TKY89351.1 hypothetical protein EX895_001882 [Sporisorium graminicola]
MVVPILIALPDRGTEHRNALQREIIHAIEKDSGYGKWAFWDSFWFYPYYNRSSTTLTPTQLYEVLDQELNLFFPEEALNDLQALEYPTRTFPRLIRQPIIATYYNEAEQWEVQQQQWDAERIAVVVDDERLRYVKFFQVEWFDLYRRACRRRLKAGASLSTEQIESATRFGNSDEEDFTDDEGKNPLKMGQNSNDDGQEDVNLALGHKYAAWFLGRKTAKWCRLRGILATRIKPNEVSYAVVNLSQANMDFEDFVEDPEVTAESDRLSPPLLPPTSEDVLERDRTE